MGESAEITRNRRLYYSKTCPTLNSVHTILQIGKHERERGRERGERGRERGREREGGRERAGGGERERERERERGERGKERERESCFIVCLLPSSS